METIHSFERELDQLDSTFKKAEETLAKVSALPFKEDSRDDISGLSGRRRTEKWAVGCEEERRSNRSLGEGGRRDGRRGGKEEEKIILYNSFAGSDSI
ncbi:unnamed protein product [Dovyalis caffra]|uniref:Uncharacterized protein n=1 Tax=Dovyalis caffra TaxID=77055 RepID=A0AAV1RVJ8_9ROSI|nr:unnamed protein product [Dovyalis caffra]